MSTAEFLPDNINMINEEGDVVAIDTEIYEDAFHDDDTLDPIEADQSDRFLAVKEMIEAGVAESLAKPRGVVKVAGKPLGQFLAIDLFKFGLEQAEIETLIHMFRERAEAVTHRRTTRKIGMSATRHATEAYLDARMLAANDDTFKN